jgi:hypothetical protein
MALGGVPLRVPRGVSPYMVARRLARAAIAEHPDLVFVREAIDSRKKPAVEAIGLAEAVPTRDMETASAPDPVAA